MIERTPEEVIDHIKEVLEKYVAPGVAQHGGVVNFVRYDEGSLLLEMSGACSGCAMSTQTLKHGIENIVRQMVPEVQNIEAMDDPNSMVNPFYTDYRYDYDDDPNNF
jgi:Fe-S cluster biogenesis protein NfuA